MWDDQGHIVTNFHVIQGGESALVTLHDNSVWPAKIIGRAADKDIAVLEIEAPASGRLEILVPASDIEVAVGTTIARIHL